MHCLHQGQQQRSAAVRTLVGNMQDKGTNAYIQGAHIPIGMLLQHDGILPEALNRSSLQPDCKYKIGWCSYMVKMNEAFCFSYQGRIL